LRRLVVLSILLVLGGLVLLLPSTSLYSQLTSSTPSVSTSVGGFSVASASSAPTDTTGAIESMLGLGLIGAGLVLETLSLFTDVGAVAPGGGTPAAEKQEANQP
jgi:hypothetical protein